MKNKGFTLVELSIVLVIIGLLIGGLLAAQSMISTAKIQATIRQIQQFDAAVANFKTKFNSFPGDSTRMSPPGNGDGWLRDFDDGYNYFGGDISYFWVHLNESGFDPNIHYSENVGGAFNADGPAILNVPIAKIGTKSGYIPFTNGGDHKNYYYLTTLSNFTSSGLGSDMRTGVVPANAQAIDIKIDDGNAISGNIFASESNFCGIECSALAGSCLDAVDTTKYNVSDSTEKCDLNIAMLSQTNDLQ